MEGFKERITQINLLFLRNGEFEFELFKPSLHSLELALGLSTIIVKNEATLGSFCSGLYNFFYETTNRNELRKKIDGKWSDFFETNKEQNPFFNDAQQIRHLFNHNRPDGKDNIGDTFKDVKRILKRMGVPNPKNSYDYFVIQTKILDELIIFLKNVYRVLTTREHKLFS